MPKPLRLHEEAAELKTAVNLPHATTLFQPLALGRVRAVTRRRIVLPSPESSKGPATTIRTAYPLSLHPVRHVEIEGFGRIGHGINPLRRATAAIPGTRRACRIAKVEAMVP